jgi:hypothetical protein
MSRINTGIPPPNYLYYLPIPSNFCLLPNYTVLAREPNTKQKFLLYKSALPTQAKMANLDKFPIRSRQVKDITSGLESPNYDTASTRTDSNKTATLEPDPKPSGSDNHVRGGITLLEEDPFSSEASKVLFDGMDKLRRCGAAIDLDLPQVGHLTTFHNMA